LAFNFNNDTSDDRVSPSGAPRMAGNVAAPEAPALAETAPAVSEAVIKFRSCRWRRPPDEGVECCGHRDVLPIAGTTSFDPEAWCPDCKFFKLRRTPKKRDDYRY
jgi:hypothetical protein